MAANTDKPNANLSIWEQVEKTDEKATKPMFAGDGVTNLTSINHNYQIKRATSLFGPIGKGWGYDVISSTFIEGGLLDIDKPDLGRTKIHSIHLDFWYVAPESSNSHKFQHFGQTVFIGLKDNKIFTDEDAPKKSLTDAIGKALSMLGFSADIYGEIGKNGESITTETVVEDAVTKKLNACKDLNELSRVWTDLSEQEKKDYNAVKDKKKVSLGVKT